MTFWLISPVDKRTTKPDASARAEFREGALEIRMYYVPEGEAILISRGQDALLVDGGSGRAETNDALAQALAGQLQGRNLRAIVASHPHRDHTNSHSGLVGAVNFAPGALYFDNGIPAADANFERINNRHAILPFQRVSVPDSSQQDAVNRILPAFGGDDVAVHVLRSSSNAQTPAGQVYFSVFVFVRFGEAWLLLTGDVITTLYETRMAERLQVLNPRTHFLKITHHGSSTGTSEDFVSRLRPAIAVASTDEDAGHRLEDDVRTRLTGSSIHATFDPRRSIAHRAKDIVIRTDGFIWQDSDTGFEGVMFEVVKRQPAL